MRKYKLQLPDILQILLAHHHPLLNCHTSIKMCRLFGLHETSSTTLSHLSGVPVPFSMHTTKENCSGSGQTKPCEKANSGRNTKEQCGSVQSGAHGVGRNVPHELLIIAFMSSFNWILFALGVHFQQKVDSKLFAQRCQNTLLLDTANCEKSITFQHLW